MVFMEMPGKPLKPGPQGSARRGRDFHFPKLLPVNSWVRPDSNLKPTCLWNFSLPSFPLTRFSKKQVLRNEASSANGFCDAQRRAGHWRHLQVTGSSLSLSADKTKAQNGGETSPESN